MLLVNGFPAIGFLVMIAWLVIPCLDAILAWESRGTERVADCATIQAGYGLQLLEAIDVLGLVDATATASGALGVLRRPGAPIVERSRWMRRMLHG
jgi:hypothetical protein